MEKLLTDKLQCKNIWKGELSENLHLAKIKQWVTSDLVDSKRVKRLMCSSNQKQCTEKNVKNAFHV